MVFCQRIIGWIIFLIEKTRDFFSIVLTLFLIVWKSSCPVSISNKEKYSCRVTHSCAGKRSKNMRSIFEFRSRLRKDIDTGTIGEVKEVFPDFFCYYFADCQTILTVDFQIFEVTGMTEIESIDTFCIMEFCEFFSYMMRKIYRYNKQNSLIANLSDSICEPFFIFSSIELSTDDHGTDDTLREKSGNPLDMFADPMFSSHTMLVIVICETHTTSIGIQRGCLDTFLLKTYFSESLWNRFDRRVSESKVIGRYYDDAVKALIFFLEIRIEIIDFLSSQVVMWENYHFKY